MGISEEEQRKLDAEKTALYREFEAAVTPAKHTCHADGCDIEVQPKMFMCLTHWRQVPRAEQLAIWRTYRPGQEVDKRPSPEYLEAARAAKLAVKGKE